MFIVKYAAFQHLILNTGEVTGVLVGNEITNKMTTKSNKSDNLNKIYEEADEMSKFPKKTIYMSPEKCQQFINNLNSF